MKFDPEKHNRQSLRLKGFDYSLPGGYFITIVTHERKALFGEIVDGEMKLSNLGLVAQQQWEKLPKRFLNVELGVFIVMPNHVHGIIFIVDDARRGIADESQNLDEGPPRYASTPRQFGKMIPSSIPAIVRAHKSSVAYRINLMRGTNNAPVWQRNYYEHIIRSAEEGNRIQHYIKSNPAMWENDDENVQG